MGLGRVDRYELLALLGQGTFGGVYRAVHVHTGQVHALKLARDSADPDATARALAEARMAASLRHPNVIGVIDGGVTAGGEAFVVMELLEGRTLSQIIAQEGPIQMMRAVRIARQMLDGLGAAHAAKIIHRDVKPSNVFVCEEGEGPARNEVVKVIDFGISKVRRTGETQVGVTMPGVAMGTPGYMAPEQLGDARSVDPRADLYAVGVTLFEMLTKTRPIEPSDFSQWMARLMNERAPSLASVAPHLPPALCAVVDRALSRDVAARWPSAVAMREALDASASPGSEALARDALYGSPATVPDSFGGYARRDSFGAAAAALPPGVAPTVGSTAPSSPIHTASYPPAYAGMASAPTAGAPYAPPPAMIHAVSAPPRERGNGALYLVIGALVALVGVLVVGGVAAAFFITRNGSEPAPVAAESGAPPSAIPAAAASTPPAVAAGKPGVAAPSPKSNGSRPPVAVTPAAGGGPSGGAPAGPADPPAPPTPAPSPAKASGGPTIGSPRIVGELRADGFSQLAGRARGAIDRCNADRTAMTVRIDLLVSSNKITIAQASPGANPGDPGVARCAAQAMRDAQFDGWAPGSGIYKEAPITWR